LENKFGLGKFWKLKLKALENKNCGQWFNLGKKVQNKQLVGL